MCLLSESGSAVCEFFMRGACMKGKETTISAGIVFAAQTSVQKSNLSSSYLLTAVVLSVLD